MKTILQLALSLFPLFALANPSQTVVVPQSSLIKTALSAEDELVIVDRLIRTTEDQLKTQQRLKELMVKFHQLKELFIQGDETKRTASAMVHTAREMLEIITTQHLQFHFSQDYLDELTLFSSIAGKSGIKRP